MNGIFLDFATVSNGDIDAAPLESALETLQCFDVTPPHEIGERLGDAEVLLTNKCRIGATEMDAAPALKLITLAATGFNNIDLGAARDRGIAVTNIRAYCTPAVVQHVFTLLLALNQNLDGYRRLLAESAWKHSPQFTLLDYPFHELSGRTLGIIGHGELGRAVARVAQAFGMQVLVSEHKGKPPRESRSDFETVLRDSDVISLHCPLTPATEKLIDANALTKMQRHAILINTARGAIVDEAALADALRAGEIGGAGIDVLSQEPPTDGNPLLDTTIPNLIVTPHIAWAAIESRQRAIQQMADAISAFRRGERFNRVD